MMAQTKSKKKAPETRNYLKLPTDQQIGKQTRASSRQKFRGLERAVAGEKRASVKRTGEVGNWWQNYLNTVNQGQQDTSAAYSQAAATGQAQIGQASAVDTANTTKLNEEAAKSAASRGASAPTAPAEREVAAQAQRNYLAAAQGNATAQMGATQRGYLNEAKRIGVGQSIASRKQEQARTRSIEKDRTEVAKERGAYSTTKRGELEDKGREAQIQRSAFGLDKQKQSASERENAADRAIAQQNANSSTRSSKASARNAATTAKGGLTPSEKRTIAKEKREGRMSKRGALNTVHSFIVAHGYPESPKARAELEREIRKESEVSPADAAWAVKHYLQNHKAEYEAARKKHKEAIGNLIPPGSFGLG